MGRAPIRCDAVASLSQVLDPSLVLLDRFESPLESSSEPAGFSPSLLASDGERLLR